MYVEDMDLDDALYTRNLLEGTLIQRKARGLETEQVEWDLEDLEGRIAELTGGRL